jgi:hypothetical protein
MGLFKFFGLEDKMEQKEEEKGNVFCKNCKNFTMTPTNEFCTPLQKQKICPKDYFEDEKILTEFIYDKPSELNKNNNCKYFKA